ncbi:SHOCT domain-containing protein [Oceanispirochaeta crateris]|nr:SHOCT domain-containing protein [Oceanispirochaeta crateris]
MMSGFGYGRGMGWGTGGGIASLLFIAVFIVGGVFFVRWIMRKSEKNGLFGEEPSALEELKTRYAKGEITKEEYLEIKSVIADETNKIE